MIISMLNFRYIAKLYCLERNVDIISFKYMIAILFLICWSYIIKNNSKQQISTHIF